MSTGRKIVFVIALMVFVGALGAILNHYVTGWRAEKALTDLAELKTDEQEDLVTDKGIVIGKYVDLYKKNSDIIGWLTVDGTRMDYPIMQTQNDPEFYLRRNFDKEYSISGVPFMDAQSDIFKPTANWMLYGHNMKDGTMFHDLLEFAEEDFYQQHKTIKFDTIYKGGQGEYQIVAAFYSQIYPEDKKVFKYYNYAGMTSKQQFNGFVKGVKGLSQYDTGVDAKYGDQLITLSTCSYHVPDKLGRFAVVAKRIK
ncbi:class B sortase [Anaerovorax odorimutans]|uniref:Class B sortase n=1 Tax=Anaerovorax odorimutans TaxID=109327 RepID=A0ABT1RN48_9FIRM|nr:class B sortase [Anaerovorax odorimutans]MCQ4636613.1 class B sortase [Anaerovorax odorimutans]